MAKGQRRYTKEAGGEFDLVYAMTVDAEGAETFASVGLTNASKIRDFVSRFVGYGEAPEDAHGDYVDLQPVLDAALTAALKDAVDNAETLQAQLEEADLRRQLENTMAQQKAIRDKLKSLRAGNKADTDE